MITSSNFFNKSLFNHQQQQQKQSGQIGPWLISRQRNFVTVDAARKYQNKSQLRYIKKRYSQLHNYSQHKQRTGTLMSLNLQLQQRSSELDFPNIKNRKDKHKNELLLPKIQNIYQRRLNKQHQPMSGRSYNSPLVYQLNFITSKSNKKSKKFKYIADFTTKNDQHFDTIDKYLGYPDHSKFNIYEKCVIQIKRKQLKSKQLQKN